MSEATLPPAVEIRKGDPIETQRLAVICGDCSGHPQGVWRKEAAAMSRSVNRVELLGHLGKDADVKFTPTGIQVGSFSLATSRRYKAANSDEWKEVTDWHRCIFWRCDKIRDFLIKGKQLYITGRLQTRSYEHEGVTRYVTEVVVEELILLGGGGGDRSGSSSSGANPAGTYSASDGNDQGVGPDDVPF